MRQDEHREQAALFAWAAAAEERHPALALLFAVPNGGARSAVTGARLKAEGVKRGVPDIWLPVARGGYHGLVIEVKAGKGRTTNEQRRWLAALTAEGWLALVCVGSKRKMRSSGIWMKHLEQPVPSLDLFFLVIYIIK